MNSIHRVGLGIAGLVAVLVMAVAVFVQGSIGGSTAQAQAPDQNSSDSAAATDATALDPETIYINPVPTAPVITVIHTPRPARRKAAAPVIHVIVPSQTSDDGGSDD
jgi:cytoskeletal protein RodZ